LDDYYFFCFYCSSYCFNKVPGDLGTPYLRAPNYKSLRHGRPASSISFTWNALERVTFVFSIDISFLLLSRTSLGIVDTFWDLEIYFCRAWLFGSWTDELIFSFVLCPKLEYTRCRQRLVRSSRYTCPHLLPTNKTNKHNNPNPNPNHAIFPPHLPRPPRRQWPTTRQLRPHLYNRKLALRLLRAKHALLQKGRRARPQRLAAGRPLQVRRRGGFGGEAEPAALGADPAHGGGASELRRGVHVFCRCG